MDTVTFQGNVLHLEGKQPELGQKAPDFQVVADDLSPRTLKDFSGNVLVLASVPSLDTPVCDLETRRFNNEAANLGDKAKIITISCDLPFAQARWRKEAAVDNVITLSDYRNVDFGINYGVLIRELRLLARAVFVVDAAGVLVYSQIVPEITNAPDYAPVLEAVKKALK